MSKTAEQVALDGYKSTVEQLERDLANAKAGNDINLRNFLGECAKSNELREQINAITRERDEARLEREYFRGEVLHARASAASPEMLRVVEAANNARYELGRAPYTDKGHALCCAVDALAASQRKAEPEEDKYVVRYRRPDTFSWMVCIRNSDALSIWRHKADAEAECARLNAEASS